MTGHKKHSGKSLFDILNDTDECSWIEAKGNSDTSRSIMETVCSFCNEPKLGGGYILLGIGADKSSPSRSYMAEGIGDPDKAQLDFATQCNDMFNIPVRPEISVEKIDGQTVLKIWVEELPEGKKPLFFKKDGLPRGAYRRIGSSDLRCTEDDLRVFYSDNSSFDQVSVKGASIADVDENALVRYRALRTKVNPAAEELTYNDPELLEALGCISNENKSELNLAGVLLFGSSKLQRRVMPMMRVDYIRVPGNEWVEDVDDTFQAIDMRGPLLLLLFRLIDAINSDLPKGFLLKEGEVQAESVGLPVRALREALVNAMMHRSYRENRPIQVIRYNNRIEIINSGFSLKAEEKLGQPGSETRNPYIASVFHETNLAETKGTGIKRMRKLMEAVHLALPTFESNRQNNTFTTRLLLHHFLGEEDLRWLERFSELNLSDSQKTALIFIREVGAVDNLTYRQMCNCDTLRASNDLRTLRDAGLIAPKGSGPATYYVPASRLTQAPAVSDQAPAEPGNQDSNLNSGISNQAPAVSDQAPAGISTQELPSALQERLNALSPREHDKSIIQGLIMELCRLRSMKRGEIARYLKRSEGYVKNQFLKHMIANHSLRYLHSEMVKHPEQAYITNIPEDYSDE